jgi:hypothetical protein
MNWDVPRQHIFKAFHHHSLLLRFHLRIGLILFYNHAYFIYLHDYMNATR